jgi:hypothetical protein
MLMPAIEWEKVKDQYGFVDLGALTLTKLGEQLSRIAGAGPIAEFHDLLERGLLIQGFKPLKYFKDANGCT